MSKLTLYNEDLSLNAEGVALCDGVRGALQDEFRWLVERGYAPGEVACVMRKAVYDLERAARCQKSSEP